MWKELFAEKTSSGKGTSIHACSTKDGSWVDVENANPEGCNQHTGPGCGGLYHGTAKDMAEKIRKEGFKVSASVTAKGVFVTDDKQEAGAYAARALLDAKKVPYGPGKANVIEMYRDELVTVIEVNARWKGGGFKEQRSHALPYKVHRSMKDVPPEAVVNVEHFRLGDLVEADDSDHYVVPKKGNPVPVINSSSLFIAAALSLLLEGER